MTNNNEMTIKNKKLSEICEYAEIDYDENEIDLNLLILALTNVLKHGTCKDVAIMQILCMQYLQIHNEN